MRPTYESIAAEMTEHEITRIYPDTAIKAFRCGAPGEWHFQFFVIVHGHRLWFTGDLYSLSLATSGACALSWIRGKPALGYFLEKVDGDDSWEFCTERATASVIDMLKDEQITDDQADHLQSAIIECRQWSPPKDHPWYEAFSELGLETEDAGGCDRPTQEKMVQYYALQRFVELFNEWEGDPKMITLQCADCGATSPEMDEHLVEVWACPGCKPKFIVCAVRSKYRPRSKPTENA